eukprot:CAMPEP_0184864206 /NCGR_PEP_ID=MMETSP0580-20130426/14088_1 /TAXON_ID=1118495 /ORGANISM="Dactyliosolen fragilissimus" /LENGTH=463 /DNA_ID=CAMNT_0027362895 /DNA_START=37 /DNA_END=1431 /DNA_ORIENTATION=-
MAVTSIACVLISFLPHATSAFSAISKSRYSQHNHIRLFRSRNNEEDTVSKTLQVQDSKQIDHDVKVQTTTTEIKTDTFSNESIVNDFSTQFMKELKEAAECASIAFKYTIKRDEKVTPLDVVQICDTLDELQNHVKKNRGQADVANDDLSIPFFPTSGGLRKASLEYGRYTLLTKLLRVDYDSYVKTAAFLSPSRIPRVDLPNVQDVPLGDIMPSTASSSSSSPSATPLVEDCTLDDIEFQDSILDKILLKIFRNLVSKNTNGVTSEEPGILGLVEQGRAYMLKPNQTAEAQNQMVYDTLGQLMTPFLPPFYRIFMSGIVPSTKINTPLDGKQIGPWFYAPWLTTIVTPTFFGFLVGPSRPNRRKDGQRGGLVVEKCKFLQESGCKGLCLHQCKIPAQSFFKEELGLDLAVYPNFATGECQWSFGETPLKPQEDPTFPDGCLVGCQSRSAMAERYGNSMGTCS